ncbi:GTPase HflX [Guggenheimella bovis]
MDSTKHKAILVSLSLNDDKVTNDELVELKGLAEAVDIEVVGTLTQDKHSPDPATYIGKGKVEELRLLANAKDADLIIFNDELSGSTIRNLSDQTDKLIIDRTMLILDIFANRSRSALAKAQVELAQLEYSKSRLTGMGKLLSQQGAGIGTRGPGETKLESDRRKIDSRIQELKKRVKEHAQVMETMRKKRKGNEEKIVALVGYTNAGKSSIMNWFVRKYGNEMNQVYVKDMLFATLDTFVRRIDFDENRSFLLVDTVGFVDRLPHGLVDSFKATLEEVRQADLLIHVLDSSDEHLSLQRSATEQVLEEIKAETIPRIQVLNKWDLEPKLGLPEGTPVSVVTGEGMEKLVSLINQELFSDMKAATFYFPFNEAKPMSKLLENVRLLSQSYDSGGCSIVAITNGIQREQYKKWLLDV